MSLPTDAKQRKETPIYSGVLKYFPLALAEIARVSKAGNDQHNPGQPLHWDKSKSTDHGDCLIRHQLDAGTIDTDGQRHSAKVAWRALAQLEMELSEQQVSECEHDWRTVGGNTWCVICGDASITVELTQVNPLVIQHAWCGQKRLCVRHDGHPDDCLDHKGHLII